MPGSSNGPWVRRRATGMVTAPAPPTAVQAAAIRLWRAVARFGSVSTPIDSLRWHQVGGAQSSHRQIRTLSDRFEPLSIVIGAGRSGATDRLTGASRALGSSPTRPRRSTGVTESSATYGGSMAQVEGHVEAGFEAVRDAFVRNFDEHGDVGAACAVHVGGRKVVDLWGGTADVVTGAPYVEDT